MLAGMARCRGGGWRWICCGAGRGCICCRGMVVMEPFIDMESDAAGENPWAVLVGELEWEGGVGRLRGEAVV